MKEAKSPKKPLIFYYGVVLAVLLAFNMIVSPLLLERQVTEVDYGTFMRMIDDKDIGEVQMDDSEILFSNKAGDAVYKTVALQDSTLVQRLYEAGADIFRTDINGTILLATDGQQLSIQTEKGGAAA